MKPYLEISPEAWRGQSISASNQEYRPDGLFFIRNTCNRCGGWYYDLAAQGRGGDSLEWNCQFCMGRWTAAEQSRHNAMVESGHKPWVAQ